MRLLLSLLILALLSCDSRPIVTGSAIGADGVLMELLPSSQTGIDFKNTSRETPRRHLGFYDYYYNGSGVAAGDFNNDGLPDLFFAGNDAANKLYLNKGNFRFEDISQPAGIMSTDRWATGVTLVDINEDGWLDIYVCNSGPTNDRARLANQLFVNNGDDTFTERAAEYGIADFSRSTQAAFFDMDKDGDLDLFVMNHALRNLGGSYGEWRAGFDAKPADQQKQMQNTLYRNDGGQFTDVTAAAGIDMEGFGLGLAVFDFDEDGWLDVFVANDYFMPDFLFRNNGDGTFSEKASSQFSHISYYSMGCDAADFNNDGITDIGVVDMTPGDHYRNKTLMASMDVQGFELLTDELGFAPQFMFNALHMGRGKGLYSEIANMTGAAQTDWSWAALFADLDNDGWKDFIVSNGYKRDTKDNDWKNRVAARRAQPNYTPEVYFELLQEANSEPVPNAVFRNDANLGFEEVGEGWGMDTPSFSNGAIYTDLDADGDLDMVFNNLESEAFVYRNNSRGENWIQFELEDGNSINDVLFSKVKVTAGELEQTIDYQFTRGYQSFMEPLAHFGLGAAAQVDRVEVTWPDGLVTVVEAPAINKRHTLKKENPTSPAVAEESFPFVQAGARIPGLRFLHQENDFNDFAKEVLLPHRQSTLGPALAVGDVNGDGLEDIYIGGAMGQAGALFVQDATQFFVPSPQPAFAADQLAEDNGALWFDYDGDSDLDLYVCSGGGGDMEGRTLLLQDRLYRNDNGQLTKVEDALPKMPESTMAVAAHDWDNDGDLDLFVGGRTKPGFYPLAPTSYLLENQNGQFVDVTETQGPDLQQWGMVTDALWLDMNADNQKELVIAGEWQALTVFSLQQGQFQDVSEQYGLSDTEGWWYSLEAADVDNDGDLDLLAGNVGLNNKFHPSAEKPLLVYGNDFDENGVPDIVLSKFYNGEPVPVRGKECSTEQMPFLAEKFPTYASFASSDLESIYGEDKLTEAVQLQATTFASIWIENQGNGQFVQHELPMAAQLSPINGFIVHDYNRDGYNDILLAGNMAETEVETPRYDAGKGLVLYGSASGAFSSSLKMASTGLFLTGDVKAIAALNVSNQRVPGLVVANNNGPLQLWMNREGVAQ